MDQIRYLFKFLHLVLLAQKRLHLFEEIGLYHFKFFIMLLIQLFIDLERSEISFLLNRKLILQNMQI